MIDIFSNTGGDSPSRRVQAFDKPELPKRFYETASIEEADGAYALRLDGRPARTPAKRALAAPTETIAQAIAEEWARQGERVDPRDMHATRMANSAIDGVADQIDAVRDDVVRFAGTDLLCYRADAPEGLVEKQGETWDPILAWARETLGARFVLAEGVIHVSQPAPAIEAIARAVGDFDEPFRLTGLHVMTTLTGSALLALATAKGRLNVEDAWAAAHVDEDWNMSQWGEDEIALKRRAVRYEEMKVAGLFAGR